MKILLLGANGQVGHALRANLQALGTVLTSTRQGGGNDLACDLTDPAALATLLDNADADVIVNAAAYTAVDKAESDRDAAFMLNTTVPETIGAWAARRYARVIHYSTDYVFDGTNERPYREDDPTRPLGTYGESKRAGEEALRASGCRHLILRTAWVYGPHGHNFLKTMLRLAAERAILEVVDDQWGTPTSAPWIAEATAALLTRWETGAPGGTFHLTATGQTTWRGFAEEIVTEAASNGLISTAPEVRPITTAEYPTQASRPRFSVLDGDLIERRFGLERPPWRTLVHQVLDRMTSHT